MAGKRNRRGGKARGKNCLHKSVSDGDEHAAVRQAMDDLLKSVDEIHGQEKTDQFGQDACGKLLVGVGENGDACCSNTVDGLGSPFTQFSNRVQRIYSDIADREDELRNHLWDVESLLQLTKVKIQNTFTEIRLRVDTAENKCLEKLDTIGEDQFSSVYPSLDETCALREELESIIDKRGLPKHFILENRTTLPSEDKRQMGDFTSSTLDGTNCEMSVPTRTGFSEETSVKFIQDHGNEVANIERRFKLLNENELHLEINENIISKNTEAFTYVYSNLDDLLNFEPCVRNISRHPESSQSHQYFEHEKDLPPSHSLGLFNQRCAKVICLDRELYCIGSVQSMELIPDSSAEYLIVTNLPYRIQHINSLGETVRYADLPCVPWDLCVYDHLAAVTFSNQQEIIVYDIAELMIQSRIQLPAFGRCFGICRMDNNFVVSFTDCVRTIDDSNRVIDESDPIFRFALRVIVHNDNLMISDASNHRIVSMSRDLRSVLNILTYSDLTNPWDLCASSTGGVFICSPDKNHILELTKDSKFFTRTFSNKQRLFDIPQCICYNAQNRTLAVSYSLHGVQIFRLE